MNQKSWPLTLPPSPLHPRAGWRRANVNQVIKQINGSSQSGSVNEAANLGRWGDEGVVAARSWDSLPRVGGVAEPGAGSSMSGRPFPRLLEPDGGGGKTQAGLMENPGKGWRLGSGWRPWTERREEGGSENALGGEGAGVRITAGRVRMRPTLVSRPGLGVTTLPFAGMESLGTLMSSA